VHQREVAWITASRVRTLQHAIAERAPCVGGVEDLECRLAWVRRQHNRRLFLLRQSVRASGPVVAPAIRRRTRAAVAPAIATADVGARFGIERAGAILGERLAGGPRSAAIAAIATACVVSPAGAITPRGVAIAAAVSDARPIRSAIVAIGVAIAALRAAAEVLVVRSSRPAIVGARVRPIVRSRRLTIVRPR